jgi:AbrB family looped-hinge helix DNA binding protein
VGSIIRIKLREKRQITLPAELTATLGLNTGDSLDAEVKDGELVLKPSRKAALDALKELQRAVRESGVTLEELLEGGREVREELVHEYWPDLFPPPKKPRA